MLFVPDIKKNLFSVGVRTSKGFNVMFQGQNISITRDDVVVAQGVKQENGVSGCSSRHWKLAVLSMKSTSPQASLRVWHERLGHVNSRTVRDMVKKGIVTGVKLRNTQDFFCQACQMGKLHRSSFDSTEEKKKITRSSSILTLWSNVGGIRQRSGIFPHIYRRCIELSTSLFPKTQV